MGKERDEEAELQESGRDLRVPRLGQGRQPIRKRMERLGRVRRAVLTVDANALPTTSKASAQCAALQAIGAQHTPCRVPPAPAAVVMA